MAALAAGLVGVQACDSGSGTALFGDGEAGEGNSASGGSQSQSGSSSGAKPNGGSPAVGASGGSANGGSANGGSANGGSANGGVGEQPGGGAGEQPSGGASDGGMPAVQGGMPGVGDAGDGGMPSAPGEAGQGGMAEGGAPGGPICDEVLLSVEPRVPNVVFMIDRSGTMFDLSSQPWTIVKEAALTVMQEMQGELAIGFMSVAGESASCPLLDEVTPALNNHTAIAAKYNALAKPAKGESPFTLALTRAGDLLVAAPGSGEAYALMVIDGEPDYCNDGNALCPIDSVVARIQALHTQGFVTLVAGLPNLTTPAQHEAALQSYANAGLGLAVASVGDTPTNIYYQCLGLPAWTTELAATGKQTPAALGSYSNSPAAAPYTSLEPSAGLAALTASFRSLFARTKSCRFDVADFSVDLAQASSGTVTVDDQPVPFDAQNGWRMVDGDELELVGSACTAWRVPTASEISVKFPCSALSQ
jgi:hypothetical protein